MSTKDEHGLSPKQRTFADLYLGGMFATEALRTAGYSNADAAKAAHRLLKRKPVQAYLQAERNRLAKEAGVERAMVVDWLCRVILTPVGRIGDKENRELLELERVREYKDGRSIRRIRMVGKMAAVRQLCTMMGWNKPETPEPTLFGVPQTALAEMIRRARAGELLKGRD